MKFVLAIGAICDVNQMVINCVHNTKLFVIKENIKDDINGIAGCGTSVVGFIDVNKL